MRWEAWVLVASFAFTALASVAMVGKPRTATTPGTVVVALMISGLYIWLVVRLGTS